MISKRRNTFVLNVRMDIRDFATIVYAFHNNMAPSTAVGTYARIAMENMARLLVEAGKSKEFERTDEANDYLIERGLRQQGRNVRAVRELMTELDMDKSRVGEVLDEMVDDNTMAPGPTGPAPEPKRRPTAEEIMAILMAGDKT